MALEAIRTELSREELQAYTEEQDIDIAAAALIELFRRGEDIDESTVDERLESKTKSTSQSRIFTLPEIGSYPHTYNRDDVLFFLYKTWDKERLEQDITWSSVKSPIRYAALIDQNYDAFSEMLKSDIASRFERIKRASIEGLQQQFGKLAEGLIERLEEYDSFTRGSFYRAAFHVLSMHAKPEDTDIARAFIREPHQSLYKRETLNFALDIIRAYGRMRISKRG